MYESEVNSKVESIDQIPPAVVADFAHGKKMVVARTLLPWGEHCTECVWPTCYTTCDLYSPREDSKCRRFIDGMVRLDVPGTDGAYILKVRFKRWGKLWTSGNVHLVPSEIARKRDLWDRRIGTTLYQLPLPRQLKERVIWQRYNHKHEQTKSQKPSLDAPDFFLLECYNPQMDLITLSITLRSFTEGHSIPFQQLLLLNPGFSRIKIPFEEIAKVVDLRYPFHVDLIPNDVMDGTTLYFGLMDFVKLTKQLNTSACKCVVWDLDGTLWDGVLVEDGLDRLSLKPRIVEIVKELDRRGILQSIASKNNLGEALGALTKFGLREYFLYPQISWDQPKSKAIANIAGKLNIGIDAILFVDDSDFELAEVCAAWPQVKLLQSAEYGSLLALKECQPPATPEGSRRRAMYQEEAVRQATAESFGSDYFKFLRDCQLQAHVSPLSPESLDRVHELTQRTNQMNFSGNRYDRKVLADILTSDHLDSYLVDCRDRFGSYGIVGFAVVDNREPRIVDLMFSCRIQSKRVEHGFLAFLLKKYIAEAGMDVWANYRKTPRNAAAGRVFDDLGFEKAGEFNGISSLLFRKDHEVQDDRIVDFLVGEGEPA